MTSFVRNRSLLYNMEEFKIEHADNEIMYYKRLGRQIFDDVFLLEAGTQFILINQFFQLLTHKSYDEIKPAFKNHFWGKTRDRWYLYDLESNTTTHIHFSVVNTFVMSYANVSFDGISYGFINRSCEMIIPPKYGPGSYLGANYFLVSKGNEFGVIDIHDHIIIPFVVGTPPTFTQVINLVLNNRKPLKEWLLL